jgi:hypothetical protein
VHRIRRHESALFWLGAAAVMAAIGGTLVNFEGTRLSEQAHPWHHFWFGVGAVALGFAATFLVVAVVIYLHQRWLERHAPVHAPTPATELQTPLVREIVREYGAPAAKPGDPG